MLDDVIQTTDGGYAAAGSSYVGSLSYGGPGFFILTTDARGSVGTCMSCSQATHTTVQPLDRQAHDATFDRADPALIFAPTNYAGQKDIGYADITVPITQSVQASILCR